MYRLPVLAFAIFYSATCVHSAHWSYEGELGPENWKNLDFGHEINECGLDRQSPINVDSSELVYRDFPTLEFINYDLNIPEPLVVNNGHTVSISQHPKVEDMMLRSGPLDGTFHFLQVHFHWGMSSGFGSEHTIDKTAYPLEAHFVHLNGKYNSTEEAVGNMDGMAVVAVLFKLQNGDNPHFKPFVAATEALMAQNKSTVNYGNQLQLLNMLPDDLTQYYTYKGSLTTPPCSQFVTWIILAQHVGISERQLNAFRELTSNGHALGNNFRPVQPIYGRKVETSFKGSGATVKALVWLVTILSVISTLKPYAVH